MVSIHSLSIIYLKTLGLNNKIDPTSCSIIFRTFEALYNAIRGRVRAPDGTLDVTVPETDLYER